MSDVIGVVCLISVTVVGCLSFFFDSKRSIAYKREQSDYLERIANSLEKISKSFK